MSTSHNTQTSNDRGENPTAGRHPSSDIYLDDITVGRLQAEIPCDKGEFQIGDTSPSGNPNPLPGSNGHDRFHAGSCRNRLWKPSRPSAVLSQVLKDRPAPCSITSGSVRAFSGPW